MRSLRRDARPDAKRAVDVHPRWMLRGANAIDDVIERVERTGVDVACLQADYARSPDIGKRVGAHSSLIIDGNGDKTRAAESDDAECLPQGSVAFLTGDDIDLGRAEQSMPVDVPVTLREQPVTRGGECSDVRDGRTGDESADRFRG